MYFCLEVKQCKRNTLNFLVIVESASKVTELLHGTFDLLDKRSVLYFFLLVCASLLSIKVCRNTLVCFEFLGKNWKQKKLIKFFVIVGGVLFSYEQDVH